VADDGFRTISVRMRSSEDLHSSDFSRRELKAGGFRISSSEPVHIENESQ